MSTHNICFHGEIRKISIIFGCKKENVLSRAMTLMYLDYLLSELLADKHFQSKHFHFHSTCTKIYINVNCL